MAMYWPRLKAALRKLLALALALSLLPGLVELAESAEHLLLDGHLPHSEQHELVEATEAHDHGPGDEHGCTPMSHSCGCHMSSPAVVGDAASIAYRPTYITERRPIAAVQTLTSRANAPPTRPPIA